MAAWEEPLTEYSSFSSQWRPPSASSWFWLLLWVPSYKFIPFVPASLLVFFHTSYFCAPFSDKSQYSGAALGTSAAARPPVSGHPASQVAGRQESDCGQLQPKAHPHLAHVLLPGAQGWGSCSVQVAMWAVLGVTVLCRVSPRAVCGSASHCCLSSGIYCKQGSSLYFINISKSVSISHIWKHYRKILFKTKLISNIKSIEEDGSFFFPRGSSHM